MGDFLKNFAQGFFETSANTLTERKKLQDEVDAARKKAIALADPEADLFKRKKDIELEYEKKKSQQDMDQFAEVLSKTNPNRPTPGVVDSPDGVFTQDGGGATPPTDLGSVHQQLQEALRLKSVAQASGNTKLAQYYDTKADSLKSQYTYLVDSVKNEGKPATGAEGTNIVEGIEKRFTDDSKTGSAATSRYLPEKLNKFVNDPTVRPEHETSKNNHKALAQAVAAAKKEPLTGATQEVSDLIANNTEKVIRNLNVVKSSDAQISPEEKRQAALEIEQYFDSFSETEKERLLSDVNFKAVFDEETLTLLQTILGESPTDSNTAPVQLKPMEQNKPTQGVKEGATATNKKTGQKLVYMGGKWRTPEEMKEWQ